MTTIANKNTEIIAVGTFVLEIPKPVEFIGCSDEHEISLDSKLQFSTKGETFNQEHYENVKNVIRRTNA